MEDFLSSSVMTDISNLTELTASKTDLDTEIKPLVTDPSTSNSDQNQINTNPWHFSTLEDFLFYCCPECPHKFRSSISFTNHAVKNHPKAKEKLGDAFEEDATNENDLDANENDLENDNLIFESDHAIQNNPEDSEDFIEESNQSPDEEDDLDKIKLEVDPTDYFNQVLEQDLDQAKIETKDPESDFQCYHCGQIIQSLVKVKAHITEVHKCPPRRYGEPRPFNCKHCGAAFEKEKTMLHHVCTNLVKIESKEGEPLTCAKCDQTFASKRNLATHLISVHSEDKNFACPQCEYKAKSQLLITKHVRRLHQKERKHMCNICGKSFFEKWNLTDHIVAVHQKKKPYVCDKCGKAFSQKSGLSSHNTFQHPDPNKVLPVKKKREWKTEPTPCERCGKILMSKYSLEKHILHTHENVRPFNCDTCGKTFKSNSNLKEHVSQVHLNKRPFRDVTKMHKLNLVISQKILVFQI